MSAACRYCHRGGASLRIAAGEHAHPLCFEQADRADEAAMFSAMAIPPFAPVEMLGTIALPARKRPVEDLTGRRFGRLLVLGQTLVVHSDGKPRLAWDVRCDCGAEFVMRTFTLNRGARACRECAQKTASRERAWCKLSPSKAEQLRRLAARKWTLSQLGKRFGVSKAQARNVILGRSWRAAA